MTTIYNYYTLTGTLEGERESFFSSYCKEEIKEEKLAGKDMGYKRIELVVTETSEKPSRQVYTVKQLKLINKLANK